MSERPEQHGVFYPRGYVIVTFDAAEKAEQVRRLLVDGGYDEGAGQRGRWATRADEPGQAGRL